MKHHNLTIQCVFDELRLSLHIIPDSPITHTECQTTVRDHKAGHRKVREGGDTEQQALKRPVKTRSTGV